MLVFVLFENININTKFRKFLKVTFLSRNYQFMCNLKVNYKKENKKERKIV